MFPKDRRLAAPVVLLVVVTSCLLLLPSDARTIPISYCDNKADYAVHVKGVEIRPNPVRRGRLAKFSISATTGDVIDEGKLVIDVNYFGLDVHTETRNLCSETSCPISAGDFQFSHSQSLPFITPPGTYKLQMKMLGKSGNELTCISFDFHVAFASSVADS